PAEFLGQLQLLHPLGRWTRGHNKWIFQFDTAERYRQVKKGIFHIQLLIIATEVKRLCPRRSLRLRLGKFSALLPAKHSRRRALPPPAWPNPGPLAAGGRKRWLP